LLLLLLLLPDVAAAAAFAAAFAGTDDNDNFGNGCDRSDDRWRTLWEHGRMDTGPIRWRKVSFPLVFSLESLG